MDDSLLNSYLHIKHSIIEEVHQQSVSFIHLDGDKELIGKRMMESEGHFMKIGMIDSQFQDLEGLQKDENGITINIGMSLEKVCENILKKIKV